MVKQETKSGWGLMDAQPQSSTNTTSSQLSGYRIDYSKHEFTWGNVQATLVS